MKGFIKKLQELTRDVKAVAHDVKEIAREALIIFNAWWNWIVKGN